MSVYPDGFPRPPSRLQLSGVLAGTSQRLRKRSYSMRITCDHSANPSYCDTPPDTCCDTGRADRARAEKSAARDEEHKSPPDKNCNVRRFGIARTRARARIAPRMVYNAEIQPDIIHPDTNRSDAFTAMLPFIAIRQRNAEIKRYTRAQLACRKISPKTPFLRHARQVPV